MVCSESGMQWVSNCMQKRPVHAHRVEPTSALCHGCFVMALQSAKSIDGVTVPLKKFAGNLTIVTNTATGDHARNYTNVNFDRLNYLYSKYRPQGLQVLKLNVHSCRTSCLSWRSRICTT